jgi:hypothetical protein
MLNSIVLSQTPPLFGPQDFGAFRKPWCGTKVVMHTLDRSPCLRSWQFFRLTWNATLFMGAEISFTVFTVTRQGTRLLSHSKPVAPSHPASLRRILKLFCHHCLGVPNRLFHSVFLTQILYIWFETLTAVSAKMAVFWVVAPCRVVFIYHRFRGLYCLHHRSDDGGSRYFWNICKLITGYTTLQPRRQPSSYLPPSEPKIILSFRKTNKVVGYGVNVNTLHSQCLFLLYVIWKYNLKYIVTIA